MSRHTPGPWKWGKGYSPFGSEKVDYPNLLVAGGECIGAICTDAFPGDTEANSNLISAAPDLYEALKAYLAAQPQCECTDEMGCHMEAARVLSRAALAKAEGK